jgi:anaerobic sulfite reductase subunit B
MATVAEALPATGPMTPRPFRVVKRSRDTADTWTLELEPVNGPPLDFAPGQFTMLYAFGTGEVPISICGEPGGERLVHTVRAVGAVTEAICASKPDSVLGVRGPFGRCWPLEEAIGLDVVIVAGGIGLPPLRPALYECLRRRSEFGDLVLLYGARTPADLVYRREVERWRGRFDLEVDVTVDRGEGDWLGNVGVVPKLIASARFDPDAAIAMICGPEIMMRFAAEALLQRGMPAERIWVSMERNMKCGLGFCGHCQLGSTLICRDGPVYRWDEIAPLMAVREL